MSNKAFPGYWRYMWLFWMQPLLLHRILVDSGIDPQASLHVLRRRGELKSPVVQEWLKRNGFMLLMAYPLLGALLLFLRTFGYDVDWSKAYLTLTIAVVFGVAASVAIGVAVGVALGVAVGVALGVAVRVTLDVAFGVGVGLFGGVAIAVTGGAAGGVAVAVLCGVAFSVIYGVGFGVAAVVAYFRVWALPATAIRQALTYIKPRWRPPILDYDLLYFPIPFLKSGTLRLAELDPHLAQEVLEACTRSPGCLKTGVQIRELLQVIELTSFVREQQWQQAADLQGFWLAGRESASPALLAFADVARFVLEASHIQNPYQKYPKLGEAQERLSNHGKYLALIPNHLNSRLLQESLPVWNQRIQQLLADNHAA